MAEQFRWCQGERAQTEDGNVDGQKGCLRQFPLQ